jgi:uncharacterized membrane protein YidH (DUF202 family)
MPKKPTDLLSLGVFVVIVAICLLAYAAELIKRTDEVLSLIIAFYGVWVVVLAGIRVKIPEKYERGAFSTFVGGVLLVAIGGAWFLNIQVANLVYTLAVFLVIVGILAVASALRMWRK